MNTPHPDYSNVKPPTKHAAEAMIQNLHAADPKNSKQQKLSEQFVWRDGDIEFIESDKK